MTKMLVWGVLGLRIGIRVVLVIYLVSFLDPPIFYKRLEGEEEEIEEVEGKSKWKDG
jgi:hypothetical protein